MANEATELLVVAKKDFISAVHRVPVVSFQPHTTARGLNNIMWAHHRLLATCAEVENQFIQQQVDRVQHATSDEVAKAAASAAEKLRGIGRVADLGATCSLRTLRLHWASLVPLMRRSAHEDKLAEDKHIRAANDATDDSDTVGQRAVSKLRHDHVDNLIRRQRRLLRQVLGCVNDFVVVPDDVGARDLLADDLELLWCVPWVSGTVVMP